MNKKYIVMAVAAASAAMLAGCASPRLDYQGAIHHGALAGKVFALDTQPAVGAKFPPAPSCPFVAGEQCRHWVMNERDTLLTYNRVLASALMQSGATPTGDDAAANFVVLTQIAPAAGHRYIVKDDYLLGKSVALAGLTFAKYTEQNIHAMFHVQLQEHGKIVSTLDIPVSASGQVKSPSLDDGSGFHLQSRVLYRDWLRPLVAKIVAQVDARELGVR